MATYTKLKGVTDIGDSLLNDQLESNLIAFFDWGLINVGAFFNTVLADDKSRLRPIDDPRYVAGTMWEPYRNNIVWETGIEYKQQPIRISGVYVNNAFYPTSTTGVYSHYFDYEQGRLVFNNPVSTNSVVKMEYTARYFNFTTADAPWFRQVMFNSFRVDDNQFLQFGSGVWSVLGQNRVQLPAVVVECVPKRTFEGYQIGGGQIIKQDILYHIFTENPWDRKTVLDIISYQNMKTIHSFDNNLLAEQNKFPFDDNGALVSGALTYPEMVGTYYWKTIFFNGMSSQESISAPPLYQAVVRSTCEIVFPEL
jgi:hypothetical protein